MRVGGLTRPEKVRASPREVIEEVPQLAEGRGSKHGGSGSRGGGLDRKEEGLVSADTPLTSILSIYKGGGRGG